MKDPDYDLDAIFAFYGKNPDLFWKAVSAHYPLSGAQIHRYREHIYIGWLSRNTRVVWTPELIAELATSLDWMEISMNPAVVWTLELLQEYADKIDWGYKIFQKWCENSVLAQQRSTRL